MANNNNDKKSNPLMALWWMGYRPHYEEVKDSRGRKYGERLTFRKHTIDGPGMISQKDISFYKGNKNHDYRRTIEAKENTVFRKDNYD